MKPDSSVFTKALAYNYCQQDHFQFFLPWRKTKPSLFFAHCQGGSRWQPQVSRIKFVSFLYYFIKHFTHFILSLLSNTTEYEKDHVESRPKKTGRHPSPEEGEESSDEQPTVDGGGEKAAEGFGPPRGQGGSF